jgi:hypothetical protein
MAIFFFVLIISSYATLRGYWNHAVYDGGAIMPDIAKLG